VQRARLARRRHPWVGLLAALAALIAIGWVLGAIAHDGITGDAAGRLDRSALRWFVAHREAWLTRSSRLVTEFGGSDVLVPVMTVVAIPLALRQRSVRVLAYFAATYAGAELLFRSVKQLTQEPRPPLRFAIGHYDGLAFPSGHATLATAMWGAAAVAAASLSRRRVCKAAAFAAAFLIALLIGLTRLYLGAHWLTDVLGGWILGAAWIAATTLVFTRARDGTCVRGRRCSAPRSRR